MPSAEYFRAPDGTRIAYAREGRGAPLVFLHGIGGNRRNWQPQLPEFASAYTCVAWDARGYGDSDDDPPLASFQDLADDLAALITHLDLGPAHIVGLSMGGMIALDLVDRQPAMVASLVLAGSAAGFGPSTPQERAAFLDSRLTPLLAGARIADIAPGLMDVLVTANAGAEARAMVLDSLLRLRPAPYMRALQAFVTTDFTASITRIDRPTLVLVGDDDRVLPPVRSQQLAAGIRGAQLTVIPGCGHLSNIECAAAFNDHLGTFLRRLAQRSGMSSA